MSSTFTVGIFVPRTLFLPRKKLNYWAQGNVYTLWNIDKDFMRNVPVWTMWSFINVRSPNDVTEITHQDFWKGKCHSKTGVSARNKVHCKKTTNIFGVHFAGKYYFIFSISSFPFNVLLLNFCIFLFTSNF